MVSGLGTADQLPKSTQFQSINDGLISVANTYNELLNELDSRMHKILNKRAHQESSPEVKENPAGDFTEAINRHINRISCYNERLCQILNHLSEII